MGQEALGSALLFSMEGHMPPMYGKCPACGEYVTSLDVSKIDAHAPSGKTLHGAVFSCPRCQIVLSAGMDPVALAHDLADLIRDQR